MLKIEKEYLQKFGDIPLELNDRILQLLEKFKKSDFEKLQQAINDIQNIKFKEVNFTIYLVPKATPRPRLGQSGSFYVKGAKFNYEIFKKIIEMEKIRHKIITPTKAIIKTYFQIPSNMTKVDKVLAELGLIKNISYPDWDNLGKTYSDMIQPTLLINDSLIYDGRVIKLYSSKPRIEVTLQYYDKFETNYNMGKVTGWKDFIDNE